MTATPTPRTGRPLARAGVAAFSICAAAAIATAGGCIGGPAEQRVTYHIDPIRIEPIYIRQDITVRCAPDEPATRPAHEAAAGPEGRSRSNG